MHTITPYSIKCFDQQTKSQHNPSGYSNLDNIRGNDLYDLLKRFFTDQTRQSPKIVQEDKKAYYFSDVDFRDASREVWGLMHCGIYGIGTKIVDINNGQTVFNKGVNNADMIRHYFHFFIPAGRNEAICLVSAFRGDGIKTLLFTEFDTFFRGVVNLGLGLNPLAYDRAMREWQEAVAKEIRVIKFNSVPNIEEVEINGGHLESELTIKPKRRFSFGTLRQFFQPGSEQALLVETLTPLGSQIKTVVQLGNRKRIFTVGPVNNNIICQIDFSDDVQLIDGMPTIEHTKPWASTIIEELCVGLYPGNRGVYNGVQN
jgi:hypothetical protein